MKTLLLGFLFLLLVNCTRNENEFRTVVKQNNEFLKNEIETLKQKLSQRSTEQPGVFDTVLLSTINEIVKKAHLLNSSSEYKKIFEKLQQAAKNKKLKVYLNPINSQDLELLKNSLYINTLKLYQDYEFKAGMGMLGTNCLLGDRFKIWKSVKNDSVFLEVKTWNQYIVQTDSVVDANKKRIDFIDNENNTLRAIKYNSSTENSIYYGKVFYVNDESQLMLLQNLHDTIRK